MYTFWCVNMPNVAAGYGRFFDLIHFLEIFNEFIPKFETARGSIDIDNLRFWANQKKCLNSTM